MYMVNKIFGNLIEAVKAYLKNDCPWYENPDGNCTILQPTVVNMGEDIPLHLLFPVHYSQTLSVIPAAKQMSREVDAFLVLMVYGEVSESQMEFLILELAQAQVIPLWIGEENRKKFSTVTNKLRTQSQLEQKVQQEKSIIKKAQ